MIVSVGKAPAEKLTFYRTTCTDKTCRNILEFNSSDVTNINNFIMGRTTATYRGISCPDCHQILKIEDFEVIREKP